MEAFADGGAIQSNTEFNVTAETADALVRAEANLGGGGILTAAAALADSNNTNTTRACLLYTSDAADE